MTMTQTSCTAAVLSNLRGQLLDADPTQVLRHSILHLPIIQVLAAFRHRAPISSAARLAARSSGMPLLQARLKAVLYLALNILSGTGIVFLNKAVFTIFNFHYIYALTCIHAITTCVGMYTFSYCGLFETKSLPSLRVMPLAAAFVGYIVFWNLSLQSNPVGFYQLSKIMITPVVMLLEAGISNKIPTKAEQAAVGTLCIGVTMATVTDPTISANLFGLAVGCAAVFFTAIYQVWAGSKQKELQASSMQLMHQYSPWAALLLGILVPIFEPLGITQPGPNTLLGFPYTPAVVTAVASTAVLGLAVSLSTFLVIGATSSVTFNVLGHSKTIIIIAGGVLVFDETMPAKKLAGVLLALAGIFWYSWLRIQATAGPTPGTSGLPEKVRLLQASGKDPEAPKA